MGSGYKGPYIGTVGSKSDDGSKKQSKLLAQMPNYDKSVTPIEKFTKYSLDPNNPNNHGKAEAYKRGLGFDKSNAEILRRSIHKKIISGKYKPYDTETDQYGIRYKYRLPIKGPNGKTKKVIAVYQIDKGKENPRMITNYLDKERNQND